MKNPCAGSAPAPGAVFRAARKTTRASGAPKHSNLMARNQRPLVWGYTKT
jgi:hypothetical protein